MADESGQTPLIAATCGGNEECVRLLLRHGADATKQDPTGSAAADYASELGMKAISAILAEAAVGKSTGCGAGAGTPPA